MVRTGAKALAVGAVGATVLLKNSAFVPAPKASHGAPAAAAVGAAATLGAAPAFADPIGDAAVTLADAAYPFMKDVDWYTSLYLGKPGGTASAVDWVKAVDKAIVMGGAMDSKLLSDAAMSHHKAIGTIDPITGLLSKGSFADVNAAIGRLIASVPEDKTMDVYNSFKALVGPDVPAYLMSTVKEDDAKAAYEGLVAFKDVVKANPISPTEPTLSSKLAADKLEAVGAAAGKFASASYPFIKDVDWTSELYTKPLPGVSAKEALQAVDKMIVMGATMDGKLLKEGAAAHHNAIGAIDAKGVTSEAAYEATLAAIGKMIASVPASQVMDVYNTFAKILSPTVGNYNYNTVAAGDAIAAYKALMQFKDVVKAAQV
jgi:hypothetical protein